MKNSIIIFLFFLGSTIQAQELVNFNQYKYVIVNSKFDFVKSVDAYKTSSLTKFLFNKIGFKSYLDNEEIPQELAVNKCLGLFANVEDVSGLFVTKSKVELRDCKGKLIYTSEEGEGRAKDLKRAYYQSINGAFKKLKHINYSYDPSISRNQVIAVEEKPKEEKKKEVKRKPLVVSKKVATKQSSENTLPVLTAQKKGNTYQLIDNKTNVVFVLLKTNDPEKFIIKDKNGTLVKKKGYWLAEYYENDSLVTQRYNVKF